jgi:hypothetical protein
MSEMRSFETVYLHAHNHFNGPHRHVTQWLSGQHHNVTLGVCWFVCERYNNVGFIGLQQVNTVSLSTTLNE